MLEVTAAVALVLLVAREFLALGTNARSRRGARLVGWTALPFVLVFGLLFTVRVAGYLQSGA